MKPVFKNRPNTPHKIGDKEIWESRSVAIVGFILATVNDKTYILAQKRSNNMMDDPGKWAAPCGYLDWDESDWDALRREVYEETSFNINKYKKYIIFDNDKEPIYVNSKPTENRQNVSLIFCIMFNLPNIDLVKSVENYKNEEVDKVIWIPITDVYKYDWAFEHDKRLDMIINRLDKMLK